MAEVLLVVIFHANRMGWTTNRRPPLVFPPVRQDCPTAGGLLLVFDVHVLSVDYAFVLLLLRCGLLRACGAGTAWRGGGGISLVEDFGQFVAGVGQLLVRGLQLARFWSAGENGLAILGLRLRP